jgi:hydrogenase maturation factor
MPRRGKIDRDFFAEYIATRLGATRADVRQGPKHGVDFGVIDVGEQALAIATDPISILPALGFERAGEFAARIILADVAVSGLSPTHLSVSFALPPEMTDEQFAAGGAAIDAECRALVVDMVTGHTARYAGCQFPWVGHGTAIAVGAPEQIIYPDGARPGDHILVTKGPAVEATGLFANLFPEQIPVAEKSLDRAKERFSETGAVRDALAGAEAGTVTAMHDATEGGLLGAFHEMAAGAGVQFVVDSDEIPIRPGVRPVCQELGMDPWTATTAGTLVVAVDPDSVGAVLDALEQRGTPVGVAGRVEAGSGVIFDGEPSPAPDGDASWPVYEHLLDG